MTPQLPSLAVLVVGHRVEYLEGAIASVLAQTVPVQLLVDYEYGAPLGDRLNHLADLARAEYLVVLGSDDRLMPDFAESTLAAARAVDADVVASGAHVISGDREVVTDYFSPRAWTVEQMRVGPPIWLTSLVRRALWRLVGGHDGRFPYHDWDFWARCMRWNVRATCVATPLWYYRQHSAQWSKRVDRAAARREMAQRHPWLDVVLDV